MNRFPNTTLIILVAVFVALSFSSSTFAADKMTFEDYQIQIQKYADRENKALQGVDEEQVIIDSLRTQIAELRAQIAAMWDQIYARLGVTADDVRAFFDAITALEGRVDELARLSPENLLDRANEIDELADEIVVLQENPFTILSEPRNRLNRLTSRVEALKASLPRPKHDMYRVVRGDYLWKISGKPAIFDDPWKWMRIYSANREEIKDPDLIFPDQRFRIPRSIGRDEHLVAKGEFLRQIAGYAQVYGDPFKWTKIYQANKTLIQDPNLIYPEQILIVPRN